MITDLLLQGPTASQYITTTKAESQTETSHIY